MDLATFADADGEVKPIVSPPISPVKNDKSEKSDDGKKTPIEREKNPMVSVEEELDTDASGDTGEDRTARIARNRTRSDNTVTQLRKLMIDMDPPPPLDHIVFRPVGDRWMDEQCTLLRLNRDERGCRRDFVHIRDQSKLIKVDEAPDRKNIIDIDGDGNSLFRALSWWITGSDREYQQLRRAIVLFMFDFPDVFGLGITGTKGQKYTKETNGRMLNEGEWGTQCEIYGAATLLGVDIYTFSGGRWERIRPLFEWSAGDGFQVTRITGEEERTRYGLYLANDDNMHYDVVFKNEPSGKRVRMDDEVEKGSVQQQVKSLFNRPKINYEETKRRVEQVARDVSKLESAQKEELHFLFHSLIHEKKK